MQASKIFFMRSDCPISYALDFFGDKWTLLIIRDLIFDQKKFYTDFRNSKEGIATNILSDRLKRLEQSDIITSSVYAQKRTKKVYQLTPKGKDLIPVLLEMMAWSAKYQDDLAIPPAFVERIQTDRSSVINNILQKLE